MSSPFISGRQSLKRLFREKTKNQRVRNVDLTIVRVKGKDAEGQMEPASAEWLNTSNKWHQEAKLQIVTRGKDGELRVEEPPGKEYGHSVCKRKYDQGKALNVMHKELRTPAGNR